MDVSPLGLYGRGLRPAREWRERGHTPTLGTGGRRQSSEQTPELNSHHLVQCYKIREWPWGQGHQMKREEGEFGFSLLWLF